MNPFESHTAFLFARPSFAEGMGRLLDFGSSLNEYNGSPSAQLADFWAIAADVYTVGGEIQYACAVQDEAIESREPQQISQEEIQAAP